MDKKELVQKEIFDFHQKIEKWFRGDTDNKKALQSDLLQDFHPHFKMEGGSGNKMNLTDFAKWLPSAFGQFPDKEVTVMDLNVFLSHRHALAEYVETQKADGHTTVRKSSAIFLLNEDNTVSWYHLLENWI